MSAAQVGFGLYGALLVEDPHDGVGVADELDAGAERHRLRREGRARTGRQRRLGGDGVRARRRHVLVNGRVIPPSARALRRAAALAHRQRRQEPVLLSRSRRPAVHDDRRDGGCRRSRSRATLLLVTPGERVDVIVTPTGKPGSTLVLRAMLYNRGYGSVEYRSVEDLLTIEFSEEPALAKPPCRRSRARSRRRRAGATRVDLELTLPPVDAKGNRSSASTACPSGRPSPISRSSARTQLWTIKNDTKWDHPFHLHGFFFMPVDEKGRRCGRWRGRTRSTSR